MTKISCPVNWFLHKKTFLQNKVTEVCLSSFSFYLVKCIKLIQVFHCFNESFIQNFNYIWPLHKHAYTHTHIHYWALILSWEYYVNLISMKGWDYILQVKVIQVESVCTPSAFSCVWTAAYEGGLRNLWDFHRSPDCLLTIMFILQLQLIEPMLH